MDKMEEISIEKEPSAVPPTKRRNNPLDKMRYKTDYLFIILLGVVFLIWIIMIFYAAFTSKPRDANSTMTEPEVFFESMKTFQEQKQAAYDFFRLSPFLMAVLGMACAIVCIGVFVKILDDRTEICIYIGIIYIPFMIAVLILQTYKAMKRTKPEEDEQGQQISQWKELEFGYMPIIQNSTQIIYLITAFICGCFLAAVKVADLANIMKKLISILFFFPHSIILGVVLCALEMILIFVSINTMRNLTPQGLSFDVFLLCSIYLNNIILNFGQMLISQMVARWHWTEDHSQIQKDNMVLSAANSLIKHHLGTIAFNATMILPICAAIPAALTFKVAERSKNSLINAILVFYLIFNITDYSSAITSIYGHSFFKASKKTFHLLTVDSRLNLTFILVFKCILEVGKYAMAILSGLPFLVWQMIGSNEQSDSLVYIVVGFFSIFMWPICLSLNFMQKANLLVIMDDDDGEEDSLADDIPPVIPPYNPAEL